MNINNTPSTLTNKRIRSTSIKYLSRQLSQWQHPISATLTFKEGIVQHGYYFATTPQRAKKNLRHVLNVLNKKLFKGPAGQRARLRIMPFLEKNAASRLHYHIAVDIPQMVAEDELINLIRETWIKSHWGHKITHFDVHCDNGWIAYCSKHVTAESENIDWENASL